MSKEYQAYKFFILLYVVIVANGALLLSEGFSFYLWFASSITVLLILASLERSRIVTMFQQLSQYKPNRNSIFLFFLLAAYVEHYKVYLRNYKLTFALQAVNIVLFIFVYCISEKKHQNPSAYPPGSIVKQKQ